MLIENLVRLGRPFLGQSAAARETLLDITDVGSPQAVGFFCNVIIVEVDESHPDKPVAAWPLQDWTARRVQGKSEVVETKLDIAVAAPFTLPRGGNPRHAQGRYPVPAYIIYEGDLAAFHDGGVVERFIQGRWERTLHRPDAAVGVVARAAAAMVTGASLGKAGKGRKVMGLLLIVPVTGEGPYRYMEGPAADPNTVVELGASRLYPGRRVVAYLPALVPLVWAAKAEEGATLGQMQGTCTLCHREGDVVSIYSKAWPWFAPTWEAPFPETLAKEELVEGAALCTDCYAALTQGAQVFNALTRPLPLWLTRELFAPADSPGGREMAERGRMPGTIYGTGFVLPLSDGIFRDPEAVEQFCTGFMYMRTGEAGWTRHLESVAGFEFAVADDFFTDHYRITLVYFSGAPERGDIHLRAMIEDVVPAVASEVRDALYEVVSTHEELIRGGNRFADEALRRLRSLPSLLINAYGPGYVWQGMEAVLRRRPISYRRFVRNLALRLTELAHRLGDRQAMYRMQAEIRLYVVFRDFWQRYHRDIAGQWPAGEVFAIRPWQELQAELRSIPPQELDLQDVEELGFAIGDLTRQFSRQYYAATRGKEFLKHRVMTFGTNLTPEAIITRALTRFPEYAARLNMALSERFRHLNGVLLVKAQQARREVQAQPDRFLAGFWAGYLLADANRPGAGSESGEPAGELEDETPGATA
ncbi:hypothetical protein DYI95_007725 [Thermaerobacter sp. PB12/4term]|uniref:hypothetical protein n=1 Tax=Thermaerobacter sp. PB12/4term TaxID=2293838 RepID=UPI000E32C82C|nr:hypothetical protein [Thermaerobacter sp. PB12/4term]QIA27434.1 hypothetical protein DYI95_007725 [Thermaerobacter sp. PB12/4term]